MRGDPKEIKNILVLNLANIGDVVLSSPLLRALGEAYPAASIDFAATPRTAPIAAFMPHVTRVITYDKFGMDKGLVNFWAMGRKLRAQRYDLALSCNQSARSTVLAFLSGASQRIGFDAQGCGFLLTDAVPAVPDEAADAHMSEILLRLLRPIGVQTEKFQLELRLQGNGTVPLPRNGKPEIVLCPFSRGPEKDWTVEGSASVIKAFADTYQLYLIGGSGEREKLEIINNDAGNRAVVLAGSYELAEIARLLKRAALTISVDTGPAHIAEAVGANLIVLFGFDNSAVWGPRKSTAKILCANVGCTVCETKACGKGYRCMKDITAAMVISAAEKKLKV